MGINTIINLNTKGMQLFILDTLKRYAEDTECSLIRAYNAVINHK